MAHVTTTAPSALRCGIATFVTPGNDTSGDLEVVRSYEGGALVAVMDGIGHGDSAAFAAQVAREVLEAHLQESVSALMRRCHDALRLTRGVVMSLAAIDFERRLLSWLGVGNVRAILFRSEVTAVPRHQELLLRSGVVGAQLPLLRSAAIPIYRHDMLIFATDGIRADFADKLVIPADPRELAGSILAKSCQGGDDALVLVAQLT
jgi:phosphoserine phosphatase RsbX